MSVRAYEAWVGPLAADDREAFWQEARAVGVRLGIPLAASPPDWPALEAWFESMLRPGGPIVVTPTALALSRDIVRPPLPMVPSWLIGLAVLPGLALLPPRIRVEFRLGWSPATERLARLLGSGVRLWTALLPADLRAMPQARAARRRVGAQSGA